MDKYSSISQCSKDQDICNHPIRVSMHFDSPCGRKYQSVTQEECDISERKGKSLCQ